MAYPMIPMPNGFDFGTWSTERGYPVRLVSAVSAPTVLYYERTLDSGAQLTVNLPPDGFDPDKILSLEAIRYLCDALEIPRDVFDLKLD